LVFIIIIGRQDYISVNVTGFQKSGTARLNKMKLCYGSFSSLFVFVGLTVFVYGGGVANPTFPIFWNVDESVAPPVDVTKYGFVSRTMTQVGNSCSNKGCKPWTQGVFPTINYETGKIVNGGVPQNGDLNLHLTTIEETLPGWIPDSNWNGNAVLDFESWTTVWDLNVGSGSWHSKVYQNYSIELMKNKYPSLNETEIYTKAKNAFEDAATNWFVATLEKCKEIRPNANWGFYGLPINNGECVGTGENVKCGYDNPHLSDVLKKYAEQQMPIWKASDILYPSIYIPTPFKDKDAFSKAYIVSTVNETLRLAAASSSSSSKPKAVLPYAWHYYHDGSEVLDDTLVHESLQIPCELGANGVVMWGSSLQMKNSSYWNWFKNDAGKFTKQFKCSTNSQNSP
jgi:hyaluronoglucosaminidase